MNFSVVIPIRNRKDELRICLQSVEKSIQFLNDKIPQCQHEIIVVDDRSTENLESVVSLFGNAVLLKNNGSGPGAARNTGLLSAKGEIVSFIDSDCEASIDWLSKIYENFNETDSIALQGNPCLYKKDNSYGTCEEKLYLGMFGRYINGEKCIQIDTRNCAFRKRILEMYPEGPFIDGMKQAQAEARVAGNRLTKDGVDIIYCSDVVVLHKDPISLSISIKHKYRHGSGRIYVWENTPSISHLLSRYFFKPIFQYKVPFWYVIPTHIAFLFGYFRNRFRSK